MSPQSTDAVQMYYVSEGMPVAVGSSPKLQNAFQALPQDHTSAGKPLPSPPTYRNTSTYQTYQKSDSLESLLSLNVLAAQLLTDHDDLQGVDSLPSSPRWSHKNVSPNLAEAHSGVSSSSHQRFHSYSTVSSQAPATPPTDAHHPAFEISHGDSSDTIKDYKHIDEDDATKDYSGGTHHTFLNTPESPSKGLSRHAAISRGSRESPQKPLLSQAKGDSAPRIESMIIRDALSYDDLSQSFSPVDANSNAGEDDSRTPLAEVTDPMATTSLPYNMRFESGHTTRPEEDIHPAVSDSTMQPSQDILQNDFIREDHPVAVPASPSIDNAKGKSRAIDQEEPLGGNTLPVNGHSSFVDVMLRDEAPTVLAAHDDLGSPVQASGITHASNTTTSRRKISDILKEQYETKQRTGGLTSTPPRQASIKPSRDQSLGSPISASSSATSPRGHAPISLPSSSSYTSRASTDAQAERAQLLHSIISNDFASTPAVAVPSVSASKDMLWHPTEYVGPPRRRSISGTSMLGFGKKAQAEPRGLDRRHRQHSADNLSRFANKGSTDEIDQTGRRKPYAVSSDNLLSRPSYSESRELHQNITKEEPKSNKRMFTIRRKTPPTATTSMYVDQARGSESDSPFRHMINTSNLPPQPGLKSPSLGHKRSLSGSIQGLLSSFGSASNTRRKRNISVPEPSWPTEDGVIQRPTSPYSVPLTPTLNGKIGANGRQSPFKMWKYPSGGTDYSPQRVPLEFIHVSQTQAEARSSPVHAEEPSPRPDSSYFKNQPRFQGGSRAPLSSADTITEDDAEGEEEAVGSEDGHEEDEESRRLKGLASQQVIRDLDYRARVVEKFKEGDRSASSLGFHSTMPAEA